MTGITHGIIEPSPAAPVSGLSANFWETLENEPDA
jgi:hypothetical protein